LKQITVTFSDGKSVQIQQGSVLLDAVKELYPGKSDRIVAVRAGDRVIDLITPVHENLSVQLVFADKPDGLKVLWHSASHIMAQAVQDTFGKVQLGIGPSIANGFYYDFKLVDTLSDSEFDRVEARMREIIQENQPFLRRTLSKKDATTLFSDRDEPFKLELIQDIEDQEVSVYENGKFIDLCRGPHVPSTGYVKHTKLLNVAGAYWHGDERNPVLQRIYGIAFQDKKALKTHLIALEEAKKRDHRRLGKELDLFSFHLEGPGFPFWHPKGVVLFNEISDYMRSVLNLRDYQEVKTPMILNEELWHRSGHWDNYKENMYFTHIDEQNFAVKPMNCPGGMLIYRSQPHSYRDLPLKYSEMGLVHRHEKSGVLHGLFRVRQFTQDDAHVFCLQEQLEVEIIKLIELVEEVYSTFGYKDYQIELSTRPSKSIGSAEMWEKAEEALKRALQKKEVTYQVNPGEGAFYGPKIDYHIRDSLGRMWQCGTIQVDFSMPERFNLEYIGADGNKHRPVLIHRAILGSVERFIGILIEHLGGDFPVWLAPVQSIVIPVSEKHLSYGDKIFQELRSSGIRCHLDRRNEKVGYKIRDAETQKIPYMLIVGDKEIEGNTISLRRRKQGDLGGMSVAQFLQRVQDEINRRDTH
jgi:threonyl-tRNA synthetase